MYPMHNWGGEYVNSPLFIGGPLFSFVVLLVVWGLVWKGLALWHAGRRGDAWWFVIMALVNTAGILEIVYLFGVAKLQFHELFTKHVHNTHHHS